MSAERLGKDPLGMKNYTIVWQYSLFQLNDNFRINVFSLIPP